VGNRGSSDRWRRHGGGRPAAAEWPEPHRNHANGHEMRRKDFQTEEELTRSAYRGFTEAEIVRVMAGDGEDRAAALELGAKAFGGGRDTEERREASPGVLRHQRSEG
jgi:hypothetical protein